MNRVLTVVAAVVLATLAVAALLPGLVAPLDPLTTDNGNAFAAPGGEHLLGTDQSGRDVFARVVHGAGLSLGIGLGATLLALVVGGVIGGLAGLGSRQVDGVLSRAVEVLMAFPEFLLALVLIAIIGPGQGGLLAAVALAATPAYARVARARALVARESGYVRSARVLGVPGWRVALQHVVPQVMPSLLVMAVLGLGTAIVSAAGLSFLGLGPQPPQPEWGLMLSEGKNHLGRAWWTIVFPGLAIMVTVVATSVLGAALRRRIEGVRA